jgi:hypothetical protein
MTRGLLPFAVGLAISLAAVSVRADLPAEAKAKVAERIKQYAPLGSAPAVVDAVRAFNASPPAEAKGMTQEKWKDLPVTSPEIRVFAKNALATFLKSKKDDAITEIFVSGADGTKVAFLAKTSNWSHKGKPKHDLPMSGKTWTGNVEVDESTGKQQVQIGFPVLDKGKPIGSMVIGLEVAKL